VPTPTTPKSNYFYAALAAATGAYFFAVGARLLPIPGGPSNLNGPLWLILCAGLAFFLAGVAIAIQTLGHANAGGELPAGAPRWMRAAQYLIALTIFVCRRDRQLDRVRPGRAAIFRHVHVRRSGDQCHHWACRVRGGCGHDLALHRCHGGVRHPQILRQSRQIAR